MKTMKLIDFMAQACHYAQEHVGDPDACPMDDESRERYLQCTSFQMACFLAQNTVYGNEGVDWNIVLYELVYIPTNKKRKDKMVMLDIQEWKKILNDIANEQLGGWKK